MAYTGVVTNRPNIAYLALFPVYLVGGGLLDVDGKEHNEKAPRYMARALAVVGAPRDQTPPSMIPLLHRALR